MNSECINPRMICADLKYAAIAWSDAPSKENEMAYAIHALLKQRSMEIALLQEEK